MEIAGRNGLKENFMEWLNIKISSLRAPEYIGSDPRQRATWLNVICYCVEQENSGVIENARAWKDRRWQQTCGVTSREVSNSEPLLIWIGDNLEVWNFPKETQQLIQRKRLVAMENGKLGGRPPSKTITNQEPTLVIVEKPISESVMEGKGSGIGKEPPNPQRGNGAKAKESMLPTTEPSKRIALLYHRRLTTSWDEKDIKAFKKIGLIDIQELELVCRYTEAERKKGEQGMHRRDLVTFCNNFSTEMDRAQEWAIRNPKTAKAQGVNGNGHKPPQEAEPDTFRPWLASTYPRVDQNKPWGEIPDDIKKQFMEVKL